MAYKITDACVNCGACEGECPVGAISEQGNVRVIDADTCVSCGACSAACPTEAIIED
ncbi:MAG TPA: 4Fe-4S binding protein [Treponemataceae bacterium]|jgi:ferredoxin|nr:4Fe-4S binding protein [Treponemataceae bacterium]HOS30645.1 4Fe-4S binding protein [Treponemataceae bacterium]HPX25389.1 4Fe-4S binding protein [Treponemataceae bacterium]HQL05355.1 4Fe-4S binding protein [Treponemataceae bacterium]